MRFLRSLALSAIPLLTAASVLHAQSATPGATPAAQPVSVTGTISKVDPTVKVIVLNVAAGAAPLLIKFDQKTVVTSGGKPLDPLTIKPGSTATVKYLKAPDGTLLAIEIAVAAPAAP